MKNILAIIFVLILATPSMAQVKPVKKKAKPVITSVKKSTDSVAEDAAKAEAINAARIRRQQLQLKKSPELLYLKESGRKPK